MSKISQNVEKFYRSIDSIEDHRYKSWEHCYKFFRKIKDKQINEEELDSEIHMVINRLEKLLLPDKCYFNMDIEPD